jgi:5'-3' exoribonuclease 2
MQTSNFSCRYSLPCSQHLPSLDIRVGALDFLFNAYKRLLPTLGDYITNHGGRVNLSHVDVILAEVGAIEDYVFAMKHENEEQEKRRRKQTQERNKQQPGLKRDEPPRHLKPPERKVMGRAARILESQQLARKESVPLQRNHQAKEDNRQKQKASHRLKEDNLEAARALRESLTGKPAIKKEEEAAEGNALMSEMATSIKEEKGCHKTESDAGHTQDAGTIGIKNDEDMEDAEDEPAVKVEGETKRKVDEMRVSEETIKEEVKSSDGVMEVGDDDSDLFDAESSDDDDENEEVTPAVIPLDPEAAKRFKERVKLEKQNQLDEFSKNVEDKVRLHEAGWKDRYYSDKCKADDVAANGGREHLFRSYVMGLCWVMKYYYDGCPSWKWYYPFHYAPFASDLKNIERFQKDCDSFELSTPFNPVEQLMAVLPSDSSHAIPKPMKWLMLDEESPIIDFYPRDVPVDPNGKAMPWLWVVLLPFIDEERLLAAM